MSNFTARTRLRGEVTYYKAQWFDGYMGSDEHVVKFLEGKHAGETYQASHCAIAKDDKYLLGENND